MKFSTAHMLGLFLFQRKQGFPMMGDIDPQRIIPLSDAAKAKGDVAAVSGAAFAYFKLIPWPELAAAAAFVYTALRILEVVVGWFRKKNQ